MTRRASSTTCCAASTTSTSITIRLAPISYFHCDYKELLGQLDSLSNFQHTLRLIRGEQDLILGGGRAWSTPGRGCCAYGDGLTIDDWRSSRGRWITWWQRVRFIQVHNLLHLGICLAFHGKDRKDCKENDFGWKVEGWSVGCNSMFVTFRRAHT